MDLLKELIGVFAREKFYNPDIANSKSGKGSDFKNLYQLILKFPELSEREYIKKLGMNRAIKNFRILVERLKQKVLNLLCLMDLEKSGFKLMARKVAECYRNIFLAKLLIMVGARKTAINLVEESLPIAEKYEVFEVIPQYYNLLNYHYSLSGDTKLVTSYYAKLIHHTEVLKAFYQANHLVAEIEAGAAACSSLDMELAQKASENLKELQKIIQSYPYFSFKWQYFQLVFIKHELAGEPYHAITELENEKALLEQYPHLSPSIYFVSVHLRALCMYIKTSNLNEAWNCLQYCESNIEEGSINWFSMKELHFKLLLLKGQFQEAMELILYVQSLEAFRGLDGKMKANWKVYELCAMVSLNIIYEGSNKPYNHVDIENIASNMVKQNLGQKGTKLAIYVARMFNMLQCKPITRVIDYLEILKVYSYRYLNTQDTFRSFLFFNILYCHVNESKSPEKIQNMKAEMKQVFEKSGYETFELIPYELLLQWVEKMPTSNHNS